MARYSRVALYNKAKNATHNHPNLIPTNYKKDIVQIPEAKNEPVNFLHKPGDKEEQLLKPVVESLTVNEKETKMPAKVKRSAKKSASAKPKKKVAAKKTKASTAAKKTVKKASPVKAKKSVVKPKAKKSMVAKKSVKKPMKKSAKKTSVKSVASKKMATKKPVKKMAGNNKKNTKPVLKRQTKKSK